MDKPLQLPGRLTGSGFASRDELSHGLPDYSEQEKFLKLMGGKKPGNEAIAAGTAEKPSADGASYQNMQHNLEKEFDEALRNTGVPDIPRREINARC
eukprot:768377-Hanusia_phi.AAC.6